MARAGPPIHSCLAKKTRFPQQPLNGHVRSAPTGDRMKEDKQMIAKSRRLGGVVVAFLAALSIGVAAHADVSSLMTQQTAASIYGLPVLPGRAEMIGQEGTHSFRFNGAEPVGTLNVGFVEIGVMDTKAGMNVAGAQIFQMVCRAPQPGKTIETIHGLGQDAVYTVSSTDKTISVLSGDKILMVSANSSKNPAVKEALVQAATAAFPKI